MEKALQFVLDIPLWATVPAVSVLALALALGTWEFFIRARFKKIIRETLSGRGDRRKHVSPFILKLHVRWLERLAKKKQVPIMDIFDFRQPWLEKFKSGKRRKDLFRLLDFYPEFALFPCFEVALRHDKRGDDFKKRLDDLPGEEAFFTLKLLAASCDGRDFDPLAALTLLSSHLDSLRELSGDSEWTVRDFAVHVLLADQDPRTIRLLWESLKDSRSHIRANVAKAFRPAEEERERLFGILFQLYLKDPSGDVRSEAKKRLIREFADLYKLSTDTLGDEDVLHVLDLLDPASKEDENIALNYLDGNDPEQRLSSARFLERSGALERIFLSVDFGDREGIQRTRDRLEKAAGVNVLGYLPALNRTENPASLSLAAGLLQHSGDRALIAQLAQKVFSGTGSGKDPAEKIELYLMTLKCVKARGNLDAASNLKEELRKRENDESLRALIWENLPPAFEPLFVPELFQSLKDGRVEPKESFQKAWGNLSPSLSLPVLLDFLKTGPEVEAIAKQRTLGILGELKLPGLLQGILESLPGIPQADIGGLCAILASMNEKLFLARAGTLIRSVDSSVRAAIFLGLPPAGKKEYLKEIREALNDADPDVRLSAFVALSEYDEAKVLNTNAVNLLRDPIERVRFGVARSLGKIGTEATLEELKNLIMSEEEVDSVRAASIGGLGESPLTAAVDILVDGAQFLLPKVNTLEPAFIKALAQKTEKRQAQYLIEKFKDGSPLIRKLIAASFAAMGQAGETTLMELLKEDIASLKPFICEALESSGVVDIFIKQLGNRDPAVRKEAAGSLVSIGTTKAFKGIVEAARDPSPEIRVMVTKALESLNTPAGSEILKELESDPDKRVRRYTSWAMERIKAKSQ